MFGSCQRLVCWGHLRQRAFKEKLNSDVDTASAFMRRTLPYPLPCNQNRRFVRFDISGDILGPSSKDRASAAFRSAGEMAERIGSFGWGATSIGPVSSWPTELKTLVDLILGSAQPMFVVWGQDRIWLYNDAFMPESRGGNG